MKDSTKIFLTILFLTVPFSIMATLIIMEPMSFIIFGAPACALLYFIIFGIKCCFEALDKEKAA